MSKGLPVCQLSISPCLSRLDATRHLGFCASGTHPQGHQWCTPAVSQWRLRTCGARTLNKWPWYVVRLSVSLLVAIRENREVH